METIINPMRDVSNSSIHGIEPEMFSLASTFEELHNQIAKLLNDRILVAHNLPFDQRMLNQEFLRLNKKVDWGLGFCTLKQTKLKLDQAAKKYNIVNSMAHSALSDARVVAEILNNLDFDISNSVPVKFSSLSNSNFGRTLSRKAFTDTSNTNSNDLSRILKKAELPNYEDNVLSYIDALAYFLSDLKLSNLELNQLKDLCDDLNINDSDRNKIHKEFIDSLLISARRDGMISEKELDLIMELSERLGIEQDLNLESNDRNSFTGLKPGLKVCFTGSYFDANGVEIERSKLKKFASNNNLITVETVTKKGCDLVVAADSQSMSGKSKKARDFNIPIISTKEFLELII